MCPEKNSKQWINDNSSIISSIDLLIIYLSIYPHFHLSIYPSIHLDINLYDPMHTIIRSSQYVGIYIHHIVHMFIHIYYVRIYMYIYISMYSFDVSHTFHSFYHCSWLTRDTWIDIILTGRPWQGGMLQHFGEDALRLSLDSGCFLESSDLTTAPLAPWAGCAWDRKMIKSMSNWQEQHEDRCFSGVSCGGLLDPSRFFDVKVIKFRSWVP